jgi:hypothetical protein
VVSANWAKHASLTAGKTYRKVIKVQKKNEQLEKHGRKRRSREEEERDGLVPALPHALGLQQEV